VQRIVRAYDSYGRAQQLPLELGEGALAPAGLDPGAFDCVTPVGLPDPAARRRAGTATWARSRTPNRATPGPG